MLKMSQTGVVVFLDVTKDTIIRRLHEMKVDRIVGQKSGANMAEILDYRQEFYERWYDVRVIVEEGETPGSIAKKVSFLLWFSCVDVLLTKWMHGKTNRQTSKQVHWQQPFASLIVNFELL